MKQNEKKPKGYFTEATMLRLRPGNVLNYRLIMRSMKAMLACKLTLTYGQYHQMMDWRYLLISEERTTYFDAERMSDFLNQMIPYQHTSPMELMHSEDECVKESMDLYDKYKEYIKLFEGQGFAAEVVDRFCKKVYDTDDYYTFKAFCNLYYSVYAEVLLLYQLGGIDYQEFVSQFQEISLFEGKKRPLKGSDLKLYLKTMRKIVDLYINMYNQHYTNVKNVTNN